MTETIDSLKTYLDFLQLTEEQAHYVNLVYYSINHIRYFHPIDTNLLNIEEAKALYDEFKKAEGLVSVDYLRSDNHEVLASAINVKINVKINP